MNGKMTREEAYRGIDNFFKYGELSYCHTPTDHSLLYEFVDSIFDDFESRICKNCKWFNKTKNGEGLCENIKNKNFCYYHLWVEETFGCNKFEKKEDE